VTRYRSIIRAGALLLAACGVAATSVHWFFGKAPRPAGELRGHGDAVVSLFFLAGDELLVSGSMDHTIRVWDVPARTCRQVLEGESPAVATPLRQRWFVSSRGQECHQWEALATKPKARYSGPKGEIDKVAVSRSGEYLAASADDFALYVWRTGQEKPVLRLGRESGGGIFESLAFVGDNVLACQTSDAGVTLVDVGVRKVVAKLTEPMLYGGAVASLDESTLVAGGNTRRSKTEVCGDIRVWSVPGGKCLRAAVLPSCTGVVSLAVASRHGVVIGGCADGTLVVCDLATLRLLRRVPADDGFVYALALTSDERLLASGGVSKAEPGVIRLWDVDQLAHGAGPR
jgi:WD40 repeat protein